MSVIISKLQKREKCSGCDFNHNSCWCSIDPSITIDRDDMEPDEGMKACPMKSVDNLIEKIENYKVGTDFIYDWFAYNKGFHDCVEIIKEYFAE